MPNVSVRQTRTPDLPGLIEKLRDFESGAAGFSQLLVFSLWLDLL